MSQKEMKTRFRFMIGVGEDKHGAQITPEEQTTIKQSLLRRACGVFGGATLQDSMGGWMNPEGRMVYESGVVLTAYARDPITTIPPDLVNGLLDIARQRAMIVERTTNNGYRMPDVVMSEVFAD